MGVIRNIISSFRQKKREEEEEAETADLFLHNGSALLQELIASFNGKYDISIRSFSARELEKATNSFADCVHSSTYGYICCGKLESRVILVKRFVDFSSNDNLQSHFDVLSAATRDIVVTSQMSKHKNALKILGCCLEFKYPALVYEYSGVQLLTSALNPVDDTYLSWESRLRIASDIASAIAYLHSTFPTPIIYRILNPHNVIIDQHGVPKLFDFSFSIPLPPGKMRVEDDLIWINGYFDPEYYSSRYVTQKTDVFSFGVLLLVLLTGRRAIFEDSEGNEVNISAYVEDHIQKNQFDEIVDPEILKGRDINQEQQLRGFLSIARSCIKQKGEDRPYMLDVARQLGQIKRSCFSQLEH